MTDVTGTLESPRALDRLRLAALLGSLRSPPVLASSHRTERPAPFGAPPNSTATPSPADSPAGSRLRRSPLRGPPFGRASHRSLIPRTVARLARPSVSLPFARYAREDGHKGRSARAERGSLPRVAHEDLAESTRLRTRKATYGRPGELTPRRPVRRSAPQSVSGSRWSRAARVRREGARSRVRRPSRPPRRPRVRGPW